MGYALYRSILPTTYYIPHKHMTIIKPDQYKQILRFVLQVFILIIIGGTFYIYQYNMVADNRYEVQDLQERIVEAKVASAEIKNDLYQVIDPIVLTTFVDKYELVLERSPRYLNMNQWVSDSSY